MKKKYTAIDLFSGCGGLTLGLKLAGFKVLAAIESDPLAVQTYKANHPKVKVSQSDIRAVQAKPLRESLNLKKGELDLLAGCPPCQGFSALRTRNGAKQKRDQRNGLITEMLRFTRVPGGTHKAVEERLTHEQAEAEEPQPRFIHAMTQRKPKGCSTSSIASPSASVRRWLIAWQVDYHGP